MIRKFVVVSNESELVRKRQCMKMYSAGSYIPGALVKDMFKGLPKRRVSALIFTNQLHLTLESRSRIIKFVQRLLYLLMS